MSGLAKICKRHGAMLINGKKKVWDYAQDKAVPEPEMPVNSEQWKTSEKARKVAERQVKLCGEFLT